MTMVHVSVKWNKEKFDDIEANLDDSPLTFKAQLFALTGVQPERQKIVFKGKTLGDQTWKGFELKPGTQLMMLGSADALPAAPSVTNKFIEDMTEGQLARALAFPAGLKNLGNTCYMNATLQCLKSVPELVTALKSFRGGAAMHGDLSDSVTAGMRDLYATMEKSRQTDVIPFLMLNVLHMALPHFAEKDEHGGFRQQDANECWVQLMRMLQTNLTTAGGTNPPNIISQYFGGRFDVSYSCKEADDETPTSTTEDFQQLSCFLSADVKYLVSGLRAKMTEEIVKHSATLERDAKYEKKSMISRLPAYLAVQMMRFFYKEKEKVNAKILKDVKFPLVLDVYELCTPELQAKLAPMRAILKEQDDKKAESDKKTKAAGGVVKAAEEKNVKKLPYSFPDDVGSSNSGMYELQAVLTHKGRSSSSGHYVGWVKRADNDWVMCDDDVVRQVDDEEILKLSGGGDWHCAYVLLYGPKKADAPEEESKDVEMA